MYRARRIERNVGGEEHKPQGRNGVAEKRGRREPVRQGPQRLGVEFVYGFHVVGLLADSKAHCGRFADAGQAPPPSEGAKREDPGPEDGKSQRGANHFIQRTGLGDVEKKQVELQRRKEIAEGRSPGRVLQGKQELSRNRWA